MEGGRWWLNRGMDYLDCLDCLDCLGDKVILLLIL